MLDETQQYMKTSLGIECVLKPQIRFKASGRFDSMVILCSKNNKIVAKIDPLQGYYEYDKDMHNKEIFEKKDKPMYSGKQPIMNDKVIHELDVLENIAKQTKMNEYVNNLEAINDKKIICNQIVQKDVIEKANDNDYVEKINETGINDEELVEVPNKKKKNTVNDFFDVKEIPINKKLPYIENKSGKKLIENKNHSDNKITDNTNQLNKNTDKKPKKIMHGPEQLIIVGKQYCGKHMITADDCQNLMFQYDPENKNDPSAITIICNNKKIGYVNKDQKQHINDILKKGYDYEFTLGEGQTDKIVKLNLTYYICV